MFGSNGLRPVNHEDQIGFYRSPSGLLCFNNRLQIGRTDSLLDSIDPGGPPITVQNDPGACFERGEDFSFDGVEMSCNMQGLQSKRRDGGQSMESGS